MKVSDKESSRSDCSITNKQTKKTHEDDEEDKGVSFALAPPHGLFQLVALFLEFEGLLVQIFCLPNQQIYFLTSVEHFFCKDISIPPGKGGKGRNQKKNSLQKNKKEEGQLTNVANHNMSNLVNFATYSVQAIRVNPI
jgi:hypothetical protein